jgi:hypothetical protein
MSCGEQNQHETKRDQVFDPNEKRRVSPRWKLAFYFFILCRLGRAVLYTQVAYFLASAGWHWQAAPQDLPSCKTSPSGQPVWKLTQALAEPVAPWRNPFAHNRHPCQLEKVVCKEQLSRADSMKP